METNKTNWKKNLDSSFISGEDLMAGLNGLQPEMVVIVNSFKDEATFDQNKQQKVTVTGLFFKTIDEKALYKPVVLNKTNARFLAKETGSHFMEDWVGKTFILFAQKDSRHGYVVRLKSYHAQLLTVDSDNFKNCKIAYQKDPKNLEIIKRKYKLSPEVEQLLIGK